MENTNTMKPAKGVALVTGAAQGIGRAIALKLATDGYDIALNDIPANILQLESVVQEILELADPVDVDTGKIKNRALVVAADVSSEEDVKNMVAQCVQELGSLDIMIANAGIIFMKPLIEISAEEFERLFSVNVKGIMLCYKYAAIQMIKQGRGGRIVGASSGMGKSGIINFSAYSASKFAVRGLTQCAALELGKHGITVNAYAPGPILTTMLDKCDEAYTVHNTGTKKGDYLTMLAKKAAIGRNGHPEDIAGLVSYLVSKEAHYITGQSISIDGGIHFD